MQGITFQAYFRIEQPCLTELQKEKRYKCAMWWRKEKKKIFGKSQLCSVMKKSLQ